MFDGNGDYLCLVRIALLNATHHHTLLISPLAPPTNQQKKQRRGRL